MRRHRTRLLDRRVDVRDARLCVIATEGEKTEKQYFSLFQNPRVRVVVLPTEAGLSAPRHLLERLDKLREEYDLGEGDALWLMADVDHHRPPELKETCRQAHQKGVQLAFSNPCFEFWLYLHLETAPANFSMTCQQLKDFLRRQHGYHHTRLDTSLFTPHLQRAIEQAKALDTEPTAPWPTSPGTHVYRLVERLLSQ